MKKQLLFLSLAVAVLLAGCAKNEIDSGGQTAPATHISAKARGAASITVNTKAPVTGTSLNGQTADIYTASEDLSAKTANLGTMFTDVYARGTMTFDDNNYVIYDKADFGGKDGGNSILPVDGTMLYSYAFYPKGWTRTTNAEQQLTYTFDGKTDVMATWLTTADDVKLKYNDVANVPDKADFVFKHLLTRYNIQAKANDTDAGTLWGRVKSVTIKEAAVNNRVAFAKRAGAALGISYDNDGAVLTPTAFFKLSGALNAPAYADTKFEAADYTSGFGLTTAYQNACYSIVAPVAVDATSAAEVILVVKTINAAGKEITVDVPVTLDQTKFATNGNSTRGFSITLALNFRVGVIQATAIVEQWKDYGIQYEDVDVPAPPPPPTVGDYYYSDGSFSTALEAGKTATGMIYYIDPANPKKYKVMSLDEAATTLEWAAKDAYVVIGARSDTDGKANSAAIKAAFDAKMADVAIDESTFDAAFPAAAYCYNYRGMAGTDALGSWYLPAKSEVQYLWCAYNGVAPISWEYGTDASAPADAAAQTLWNDRIKAGGGAKDITSDLFWSSIESSDYTSSAWYVYFSDGETSRVVKNDLCYVRCVREL